jgi:transcription antitermination factor NusG
MVARTIGRREHYAQEHIQRAGAKTYFPEFHDVFTNKVKPLFPGYIFVRARGDGLWYWLRSTLGVLCLIMRDGVPELMRDEVVKILKSSEDRRGLVSVKALSLLPGTRVNVVGGSMVGYTGTFMGMTKHERCLVMFSLLGAERNVSIPVAYLRRDHSTGEVPA